MCDFKYYPKPFDNIKPPPPPPLEEFLETFGFCAQTKASRRRGEEYMKRLNAYCPCPLDNANSKVNNERNVMCEDIEVKEKPKQNKQWLSVVELMEILERAKTEGKGDASVMFLSNDGGGYCTIGHVTYEYTEDALVLRN